MAGRIGIDVGVATPELNGRIELMYVYEGAPKELEFIHTADSAYPLSATPVWEDRIEPHVDNIIPAMEGTNTGDESLYLSGELVITSPDGTSDTITLQETSSPVPPGEKRTLSVLGFPDSTENAFVIGTAVGTYRCEAKLYGRRSLTDTKQLLDTDIFYVHNYTEAIDIPAPTTADYEYRTAETLADLETASWSPVGTSLVINPNWWLQFRFNITNNGDEPVNVHIREAQDSKSRIAMTVTDPENATSLLPVYMKQIAPGTSKKIETLAIQLTKSGSWHFEGYVYAQRAYPRILDTHEDGVLNLSDVEFLDNLISGVYDADKDSIMSESDIRASNLKLKPYWAHYAYTLTDHVSFADVLALKLHIIGEINIEIPPEDVFILQYNPLIVHAYGNYFYYDGTEYKHTTNRDEALENATAGGALMRIEDGALAGAIEKTYTLVFEPCSRDNGYIGYNSFSIPVYDNRPAKEIIDPSKYHTAFAIYWWDAENQEWKTWDWGKPFEPGRGYALYLDESGEEEVSGVAYDITRDDLIASLKLGWNFIGVGVTPIDLSGTGYVASMMNTDGTYTEDITLLEPCKSYWIKKE